MGKSYGEFSFGDFNIGDRVVCVVDRSFGNPDILVGVCGTVCDLDEDGFIGVAFDHEIHIGHSCSGQCENGHGWYLRPNALSIVDDSEFDVQEDAINEFMEEWYKSSIL